MGAGDPARETPASCPTHQGSTAYPLGPSRTVATCLSLPLNMTPLGSTCDPSIFHASESKLKALVGVTLSCHTQCPVALLWAPLPYLNRARFRSNSCFSLWKS